MDRARSYWPRWASALDRLGLSSLAAAYLESAGPLSFLAAQFIHSARYLYNAPPLDALASTLEDDAQAVAFARFLRKD